LDRRSDWSVYIWVAGGSSMGASCLSGKKKVGIETNEKRLS